MEETYEFRFVMDKLEFIKRTLPKIIKKYQLNPECIKPAEDYLTALNQMSVYAITQSQIEDFIDCDYEDYVVDLKPGDWVYDDGEACWHIDELYKHIEDREPKVFFVDETVNNDGEALLELMYVDELHSQLIAELKHHL